jgi:LacI family transcriptional regulator
MDAIGVVAVVENEAEVINLYFLEALNGILSESAKNGQNTTVFAIDDWEKSQQKILGFCDGRVDGMIFVGSIIPVDFGARLQQHTSFVTLHNNWNLPQAFNLDIDNEAGAYCIVRHLIELGHRKIAHFTGDEGTNGALGRLNGYQRALREAGIEFDSALLYHGGYNRISALERARSMLADTRREDLPTAIFCANDTVAIGVIDVLLDAGIKIPDDISVAGFDDTLAARTSAPTLTTMRQPLRKMGVRAVELLLGEIDRDVVKLNRQGRQHSNADKPDSSDVNLLGENKLEYFTCDLVVRQSTASAPIRG